MSGIPYTKEQLAFMEKHGADMTTTELTNALNKAFSTGHTAGREQGRQREAGQEAIEGSFRRGSVVNESD